MTTDHAKPIIGFRSTAPLGRGGAAEWLLPSGQAETVVGDLIRIS
jgi:hypothetical protein